MDGYHLVVKSVKFGTEELAIGGLTHVLLVVAIVVMLFRIIQGRKLV